MRSIRFSDQVTHSNENSLGDQDEQGPLLGEQLRFTRQTSFDSLPLYGYSGVNSLPRRPQRGYDNNDLSAFHRPSSAMSRSYMDDHRGFPRMNRSSSQMAMRSGRPMLRSQRSWDYSYGSNLYPDETDEALLPPASSYIPSSPRSAYSESYKTSSLRRQHRKDSILKNSGYSPQGSSRRMRALRHSNSSYTNNQIDRPATSDTTSNPSKFLLRPLPPIKAELNYTKQQLQIPLFNDHASTTNSNSSYELTPLSQQAHQPTSILSNGNKTTTNSYNLNSQTSNGNGIASNGTYTTKPLTNGSLQTATESTKSNGTSNNFLAERWGRLPDHWKGLQESICSSHSHPSCWPLLWMYWLWRWW